MAKSKTVTNLFAKTEQALEDIDLEEGNIKAQGVGMREGETKALDAIGRDLGALLDSEPVARNALARIAIRRFIDDVRAGKITMQELAALFERPDKPKPRLRF